MLVHGGIDQQDCITNTMQVFDAKKRQWVKFIVSHKTVPLELHSMAFASQNKLYNDVQDLSSPLQKCRPRPNEGLYIFGGRDGQGKPTNRMWRYRMFSNPWKLEDVEETARCPLPRFGHCLAYLSTIDCLVVFGGEDGQQIFGDVYLFNVELSHWVDLRVSDKDQPVPRSNFGYAAICDQHYCRLYIVGGLSTNSFAGGTLMCLDVEDSLFRKADTEAKEQKYQALAGHNEVKIVPKNVLERRSNALKLRIKAFSQFSSYQPYPSELFKGNHPKVY